jgi:endoglucanase
LPPRRSGFGWAYREFAAGFGAHDRDTKAWRDPLLKALVPK